MADSFDSSKPSGVAIIGLPGELAGVREQRGWSQGDVAERLKLRVRQLDALERGDWEALPGRAFIRGTLRAYARLLEVDIEPLLKLVGGFAQAEELRPSTTLGTQMPRSGGFGFDGDNRSNRLPWAVLGVVGVITLAVFFGRDGDIANPFQWFGVPPSTQPAATTPAQVPGTSSPPDAPAAGPAGAATESPVAPSVSLGVPSPANVNLSPGGAGATPGQSAAPPASAPQDTGAAGATLAAPEATRSSAGEGVCPVSTMRFTVSQDAWIEVRQDDGRTVFSAVVRPGAPVDVDARPPVSLVIGNASQVRLDFEGRPVDLKALTVMPNNIAKVKLP